LIDKIIHPIRVKFPSACENEKKPLRATWALNFYACKSVLTERRYSPRASIFGAADQLQAGSFVPSAANRNGAGPLNKERINKGVSNPASSPCFWRQAPKGIYPTA